MLTSTRLWLIAALISIAFATRADTPASRPAVPTLFITGDSTVNNSTKGMQGWGTPIADFFDAAKINVVNKARGGRSSRTYFTEGLWQQVLDALKPGDFVLIQFGHNDGGPLTGPKARASLHGTGDETQDVADQATGKRETVHSYGWYVRRFVTDAKAKGATPIVLSPIPRNIWKDGKVARADKDYGKWAAEVATAQSVPFIDLNDLVARQYEQAGPEKVASEYFTPTDHTHTTPEGAKLNATSVVEGIRALKTCRLSEYLIP